jgi:DNA mismatch endonuclease (patch repair protein)
MTTFGHLTRSQLMARIRSTGNETTEMRLARLLRKFRICGWRRNYRLMGKPDFVWPKHKVAVFVDGCFWHGHNCGRNLKPKYNATMWRKKIAANRRRDRRNTRNLRATGWSVVRIWECILAKQPKISLSRIRQALQRTKEY